jgi:hypothetical protein
VSLPPESSSGGSRGNISLPPENRDGGKRESFDCHFFPIFKIPVKDFFFGQTAVAEIGESFLQLED